MSNTDYLKYDVKSVITNEGVLKLAGFYLEGNDGAKSSTLWVNADDYGEAELSDRGLRKLVNSIETRRRINDLNKPPVPSGLVDCSSYNSGGSLWNGLNVAEKHRVTELD